MKHVLLGLLLLASIGARAQHSNFTDAAPSGGTAAASSAAKNVVYLTPANQWSLIDMTVQDGVARFNHLQGLQELHVYVTDHTGGAVMDMKVSANANGINFKRLKKGLYFLTLVNETTEEKKAFTYNRE